MDNYTTARLSVSGENFEILVKPEESLNFKFGKSVAISQILVVETIFIDANKGLRASEDKLKKAFNTLDVLEIAETILRQGELNLKLEQRRKLVEEKRRQIVSFISRNCSDPRTGFPHPPLRIEQAMNQIRFVIDPFKSGEEQARAVIDLLRPILPLKMGIIQIGFKVPPEYSAQVLGIVKDFGKLKKSEWQNDGSLIGILEMPTGIHATFLEKLGKITRGNFQTKII